MINPEARKDCPMRGILGNCLPVGGFCIDAVSDEICEAMHNAYQHGYNDALSLLKEREAKQVIGIDEFIEGMEVGRCPSCNKSLINIKIDDEAKFCKYCGQEVKWNE